MKVSELNLMENHIIEQLAKFGYNDIEGKSLRELTVKLATFRAMEVDVQTDSNKWF